MTITNGYATLAEARAELANYVTADTTDDTRIEMAVEAASRQIDNHTGRRFWQDATVTAREFYADDAYCVTVDDISTVTGLLVKADDNDDGTFETSYTITTDFILLPANAADGSPVRPYTEVRLVSGATFPRSSSGRPGAQVTAKFGWPAVPTDVKRACLIQTVMLFKAADAAFGALQFGADGIGLRIPSRLHPLAEALLEGYCKPRVG